MPSKYSRKNRDRRGGHKTSVTLSKGYGAQVYGTFSPVMRAILKRETTKLARRQDKCITEQALAEYEKDMELDYIDALAELWGDDDRYDYWEFLEDYADQEQPDPEPYIDRYDYDYFHPSPFDISDRRNTARERSHADLADCTFVSAADVGKTISEILESARIEADAERAWWRR